MRTHSLHHGANLGEIGARLGWIRPSGRGGEHEILPEPARKHTLLQGEREEDNGPSNTPKSSDSNLRSTFTGGKRRGQRIVKHAGVIGQQSHVQTRSSCLSSMYSDQHRQAQGIAHLFHARLEGFRCFHPSYVLVFYELRSLECLHRVQIQQSDVLMGLKCSVRREPWSARWASLKRKF